MPPSRQALDVLVAILRDVSEQRAKGEKRVSSSQSGPDLNKVAAEEDSGSQEASRAVPGEKPWLAARKKRAARGSEAVPIPLIHPQLALLGFDRLSFSNPWQASRPIVLTAPHNIALHRDGHEEHKTELHTAYIARTASFEVGAAYISWSAKEIERVSKFGADSSNRDPNYLTQFELSTNAFHLLLRASHASFKQLFVTNHQRGHIVAERYGQRESGDPGAGPAPFWSLHVDVHGCRGPPTYDSHCIVGLGAMTTTSPVARVRLFRQMLKEYLTAVLRPLQDEGTLGSSKLPVDVDDPRLQGSWQLKRMNSLRGRGSVGSFKGITPELVGAAGDENATVDRTVESRAGLLPAPGALMRVTERSRL